MFWWTLQRLKAKTPQARRQAIERLAHKPQAVDALLSALMDPAKEVRQAAAIALKNHKDEKVLGAVIQALQDPETRVREAAAEALAHIATPAALADLVPSLKDSSSSVRWHVVQALDLLGWRPATIEEQAWRHVALGEYEKAADLGAVAVESLTIVLSEGAYHKRLAAIEALSTIGDARIAQSLLTALNDPDFHVQIKAIEALAKMGDRIAVEPLIQLLSASSPQLRAEAAEALGKLGDERAVNPLTTILQDTAWDVRLAAVTALGSLNHPAVMPYLAATVKDSDREVREASIKALQSFNDPRSIEFLVPALIDVETTIRQTALAALTKIDPSWEQSSFAQTAIPELKTALHHRDYWVRQSAADTLAKIGEVRAVELNQTNNINDPSVRMRQGSFETFCNLMKDADSELRLAATQGLGRLGDKRATIILVEALQDDDPRVCHAAAHALQEFQWDPMTEKLRSRYQTLLQTQISY